MINGPDAHACHSPRLHIVTQLSTDPPICHLLQSARHLPCHLSCHLPCAHLELTQVLEFLRINDVMFRWAIA